MADVQKKGDKVKRFIGMGLLATGAVTLFAAGCAQNGFATVAVTQSESAVASCQAIGEVKASSLTPDEDVKRDLIEAVKNKGGNTLLVQSDTARAGTAYQCSNPAIASATQASQPVR